MVTAQDGAADVMRETKQAVQTHTQSHAHEHKDDDVMFINTLDDDDDDAPRRGSITKQTQPHTRPAALYIPSFITTMKEGQESVGSWQRTGTDSGRAAMR